MDTYRLPELPYDYAALEPHISGAIMQLHHDKHHAAYVKGANAALDQLKEERVLGNFVNTAALERALAFNVSGHILHSIFWTNLTPHGGGEPEGEFAKAIDHNFGNFDHFKKQMTTVASTIMGSGWAALVWEPAAGCLLATQIYDHQGNVSQAGVPLMVIDAWEHAYYLQYKNQKAAFFDAVWNLWDWECIGARFESVQKTKVDLVAPAGGWRHLGVEIDVDGEETGDGPLLESALPPQQQDSISPSSDDACVKGP